jgi:transposase
MIGSIEKRIVAQHRSNETSKRLETIPGIGVVGATTITALVTDPKAFRSGRDFAAWIGLVPRQHSTGGKERLGGISKQGDRYLRRLLVIGATAVVRHARQHPQKHPWIMRLLAKKPAKLVAVAVANKMAAHRLGDHGQGRILSSAGACCRRLKRLGNGRVRRQRSKTIELRG